MKQVTIDWDYIPRGIEIDDNNIFIASVISAKIQTIPYWYKVKSAKFRVSSSGNGLHIILAIDRDVSDIDSLFIRAVMNDDYKRLRLDMIRYLYATREIGLIFSEKINVGTGEKKTAGEWINVELEK